MWIVFNQSVIKQLSTTSELLILKMYTFAILNRKKYVETKILMSDLTLKVQGKHIFTY